MLIEIAAETTVELAPHLKHTQLKVMTNGNDYILILPNFELYCTWLSHSHKPLKVTMDVLGIRGAPRDAKLLGKFFTCLTSETGNNHHDGVFLLESMINRLRPQTYAQVLKENNFFLSNVATIPINLEFDVWFAIINPNSTSENAPISLDDHLLHQPWFLCIESVAHNKCLIVITKSNLHEVCVWINANLEPMVRKSIPPGIDLPLSLLP